MSRNGRRWPETTLDQAPTLAGMTIVVFTIAGLLVLVLVIAAGHRILRSDSGIGGGVADGLGSFIDVFDPARARADRDLKSHNNQGAVIPNPDDDDRPVEVDLVKGTARIRRR